MKNQLKQIADYFLQYLELNFTSLTKDMECEEYLGYNGQLANFTIKFRKAKITPKKIGQFVTVWQRNAVGITVPYTSTDPFDFYLIMTNDQDQIGFFIFPRSILAAKGILTTANKEGKRGFRVYPDWDTPTNTQALKTQQWQSQYFINCTDLAHQALEKTRKIIQPY